MVKIPPPNAGDTGETDLIPGLGRHRKSDGMSNPPTEFPMSVTPIKEITVTKEVRQLARGQQIPGAIRYPLPRSRARLQSEVVC